MFEASYVDWGKSCLKGPDNNLSRLQILYQVKHLEKQGGNRGTIVTIWDQSPADLPILVNTTQLHCNINLTSSGLVRNCDLSGLDAGLTSLFRDGQDPEYISRLEGKGTAGGAAVGEAAHLWQGSRCN